MVVFEFDDFATVDADEVVVVGVVEEVWVVGGLSVAEFYFADEVGFYEEAEGAVDGGAGGFGAGGAEAVEEFIRGEVFVGGEDDFEDFVSLGGLTEAFFLDKIIKTSTNFWVHGGSLRILG